MTIKPLKSPEDIERKNKKRNLIIGIVLISLMILSTVGFAILEGNFNQSQKHTYNSYDFTQNSNGYWQTKIKLSGNDKTVQSIFLPGDVENVSSSGNILLSDFEGKTVYYITNSSGSEISALSILDNELKDYYLRAQTACSPENENSSSCVNIPIKTCDDANNKVSIIKIENIQNSTASINYKNYCLTISGSGMDLTRAAEKIIFKIYGIMD